MSEIERIQNYIEGSKLSRKARYAYCMYLNEMDALHEALSQDEFSVMYLIFEFGRAKGYRAAKAEASRG